MADPLQANEMLWILSLSPFVSTSVIPACPGDNLACATMNAGTAGQHSSLATSLHRAGLRCLLLPSFPAWSLILYTRSTPCLCLSFLMHAHPNSHTTHPHSCIPRHTHPCTSYHRPVAIAHHSASWHGPLHCYTRIRSLEHTTYCAGSEMYLYLTCLCIQRSRVTVYAFFSGLRLRSDARYISRT